MTALPTIILVVCIFVIATVTVLAVVYGMIANCFWAEVVTPIMICLNVLLTIMIGLCSFVVFAEAFRKVFRSNGN